MGMGQWIPDSKSNIIDMEAPIKNHRRTIRAWAMFDWSNSAYNLVITSTIFPAYYTAITVTAQFGDVVHFFGIPIVNTALSNFALGLAYLVMALLLPILSSIADYRQNKMAFMKAFTYLGGFACIGLFFFKLETLEWGIICFSLAAVGYIGGLLFNNSYLPQIASVDQQDRVSALGFAYGYVGCVTLQIICFVIILKPEWFGITDPSLPARLSFLLVGLWWIGFAQIPFRKLPKDVPNTNKLSTGIFKKGFRDLKVVYTKVRNIMAIRRFLPAYFLFHRSTDLDGCSGRIWRKSSAIGSNKIDWNNSHHSIGCDPGRLSYVQIGHVDRQCQSVDFGGKHLDGNMCSGLLYRQ